MRITETYRALNTALHSSRPRFGSYGARHAAEVGTLIRLLGVKSVLDYGCGKATLAPELKKTLPAITVQNYDPALLNYNADPTPADLVVCTDVLEHVEPECVENVLDDIKRLANKAVFLVICTVPDTSKNLSDGSNPHRSVFPADRWIARLKDRFTLTGQYANATHLTVTGLAK